MSKTQRRNYALLSLFLFGTEVIIALFFRDSLIRPIFGDFLVVILLYCIFRTITPFSIRTSALITLSIAYGLEILQYINILKLLNIKRTTLTDMILGSRFDWWDMLAYTLGIFFVFFVEHSLSYKNKSID